MELHYPTITLIKLNLLCEEVASRNGHIQLKFTVVVRGGWNDEPFSNEMAKDELKECFVLLSVPHVQMSSGMSSMLLASFISLFVVGDDIDDVADPIDSQGKVQRGQRIRLSVMTRNFIHTAVKFN